MDTFNPVKYSIEENQFLLENVGTAPIVALNKSAPEGVNKAAVRPILQEVYDREQLRSAQSVSWVGINALKEVISKYIEVDTKWASDYTRSRGRVPRFPTMYTKDGKGKFHLSGSGSDSNYPRTWEDEAGNKHSFELNLDGFVDDWEDVAVVKVAPKSLIHDEAKNRIECPICAHTESYKTDSRGSYNAARARMSKHLKKPGNEVSLHSELHTNEFGS